MNGHYFEEAERKMQISLTKLKILESRTWKRVNSNVHYSLGEAKVTTKEKCVYENNLDAKCAKY